MLHVLEFVNYGDTVLQFCGVYDDRELEKQGLKEWIVDLSTDGGGIVDSDHSANKTDRDSNSCHSLISCING